MHVSAGAPGGQQRAWDLLELGLHLVRDLKWVLGVELGLLIQCMLLILSRRSGSCPPIQVSWLQICEHVQKSCVCVFQEMGLSWFKTVTSFPLKRQLLSLCLSEGWTPTSSNEYNMWTKLKV